MRKKSVNLHDHLRTTRVATHLLTWRLVKRQHRSVNACLLSNLFPVKRSVTTTQQCPIKKLTFRILSSNDNNRKSYLIPIMITHLPIIIVILKRNHLSRSCRDTILTCHVIPVCSITQYQIGICRRLDLLRPIWLWWRWLCRTYQIIFTIGRESTIFVTVTFLFNVIWEATENWVYVQGWSGRCFHRIFPQPWLCCTI